MARSLPTTQRHARDYRQHEINEEADVREAADIQQHALYRTIAVLTQQLHHGRCFCPKPSDLHPYFYGPA
jgi:hypothetical protein